MSDLNRINDESLENVVGGALRTVQNEAVDYANVREQPGLSSKVFFTVNNGQQVETTGNKVMRDGYMWYEIRLAGAYDYGWISGSLIGY